MDSGGRAESAERADTERLDGRQQEQRVVPVTQYTDEEFSKVRIADLLWDHFVRDCREQSETVGDGQ